MTEHTFTIDDAQQIPADDGSFTWAIWATAADGTGVMGYGDTKADALADLGAAVAAAFAGDTTIDPPETNPDAIPITDMPPDWTFDVPVYEFSVPLLGSGLLTGDHDLLA